MRSFPLPLIALVAPALALSACSAEKSEAPATEEAAAADGGPAVPGAVAPGVAFRYDYAFTLPGKAISGALAERVQEHPGIEVRLTVANNREALMAQMEAGEVDLSGVGTLVGLAGSVTTVTARLKASWAAGL